MNTENNIKFKPYKDLVRRCEATQYFGKFIAFVDKKLVDSDVDSIVLNERVEKSYPNKRIYITKVGIEILRSVVNSAPYLE